MGIGGDVEGGMVGPGALIPVLSTMSVQQRGRLPLPPSALHVRGEVQGTRRTTFCTIPTSRREHLLVSVMHHAPPRDPHVASALTPRRFHQVQPRTIVIIFSLEFGASFFNNLTLLNMSTLKFRAQYSSSLG